MLEVDREEMSDSDHENPPEQAGPHAMKWWGWGDPNVRFPLADRPGFQDYLRENLTIEDFDQSWDPNPSQFQLPPSRLDPGTIAELQEHLGVAAISVDDMERIRHSFGRSYIDMLNVRRYQLPAVTDAVVFPETEDHLLETLQWADSHELAVVPYGGGTSVVGGVTPLMGEKRAVVTVNLRKMTRVVNIDRLAQTVSVEAGVLGPHLESQLADYGFTLGHFPQSFEYSTVGGWVAARSSGQNSVRYGGIEKLVVGLRVVTAKGIAAVNLQPRHAMGPDLRELFIGSEGCLGVISQVTFRVSPLPALKSYRLLMFDAFDSATNAARQMVQEGLPVAMIRVSDEAETEVFLRMALGKKGVRNYFAKKIVNKILSWKKIPAQSQSAMLVGFEGTRREVGQGWSRLWKLLKNYKYASLGRGPGRHWLKDRFFLPYLRDELLSQKILIETFETAGTWTNYLPLYKAIQDCVKHSLPERHVLLCHLSHIYSNGASLYFTVIGNQREAGAVRQWEEVKKNLNLAIRDAGGVISHHHGIGTDHRDFTGRSPVERDLLAGIKMNVDPKGIFNPGKLLN